MHKSQKGFGALEVLLLMVIIGIIGGAGWYVYGSQKQTNKSLDSASKNISDLSNQKKTDEKDETANWLLFTSAQDTFSLRIPDGWTITQQDGVLIYALPEQMTDKAGTPATVHNTTGGRDGIYGFSVIYDAPGTDLRGLLDTYEKSWNKLGNFVSQAGTGVKYSYDQTQEPETGLGPPKGSKSYFYYFKKDDKSLRVSYVLVPGKPNQLDLVEKAIKTLSFK